MYVNFCHNHRLTSSLASWPPGHIWAMTPVTSLSRMHTAVNTPKGYNIIYPQTRYPVFCILYCTSTVNKSRPHSAKYNPVHQINTKQEAGSINVQVNFSHTSITTIQSYTRKCHNFAAVVLLQVRINAKGDIRVIKFWYSYVL